MNIGIIGGTGLEDCSLEKLDNDVVKFKFVSRHGKDHLISPSDVDYIANIRHLYEEKCEVIIAFNACGSLREEMSPGSFVIPNQFIDFTNKRNVTVRRESVVHTPMAEPFDRMYSAIVGDLLADIGVTVFTDATIITIEGPRFSTRAESKMYKTWGADVIGMTTSTECIIANELGIPYVTVAMVTDYDCWRENTEPVNMEMVKKVMKDNASVAKTLIKKISEEFQTIF